MELSRSLLSGWVDACCRLLSPLEEALHGYVMTDGKLHADDTPVQVLLPGNKKTKTGRLWAYVRDDRNQALAQAALTYRYGDEHQPVTTADILTPRRREDYGQDLWSAYQTIQENMLKGGISGRSAKGKRIHTRAIHNIDTDIKLNRALWVMAETLLESLR